MIIEVGGSKLGIYGFDLSEVKEQPETIPMICGSEPSRQERKFNLQKLKP